MSILISTFREPVRVLIGDNDPDIQFRDDAQLDAAARAVVNLGKVTGDPALLNGAISYTLDSATTGIIPTFTPVSDPKAWAQVVYHTARLFAVDVTPSHWRTRAFSETIGENKERVFNLLMEIYGLENGTACGASDYT
jgi:hypothetical protein